ncbi:MAG: threonine--tRNA ligase [Patescibacteria group bacterium]|nr:threonine--tRNA ligase [Patescibacteria group bacterium]
MTTKLTNDQRLEIIRHSTSHVLATAVLKMFPEVKFAIGPAIENGFYYDFELPRTLIPEDLPLLENEMKKIIADNHPFEKKMMQIDEAIKHFKKAKQPYKVELIEDLVKKGEKEVMIYKSKSFIDLCSGPHLESTGEIDATAFKLTRISGAYWKGDENRQQLQRIYGVVFENKKKLKAHLQMMDEAEERNHRKIGKEMELFANFPEIGQGLPVWLPNGYTIRKVLEDYMIKMERNYGYVHILTPHISKMDLFKTSGHLGFYDKDMYAPLEIDNETFYLKPMNCPAGMMVYKMKPRSYRELPYKQGEFGTVYRYEKSGELHGLQRVRGFTQNDAHIFCTEDQLKDQFLEVVEMLKKFYQDIGFTKYRYQLSLSDKDSSKYVGKREDWIKAEETLREVLKENGEEFYEEEGEAAFYGPKLDVMAVNVYGKEDAISTVQVDFNLPERFDLNYIDKDGNKTRPFVIHRALIGSFERFFAFLIEFYAGKFPLWFAPVQVTILPVSEKFKKYARKVESKLKESELRVEMNDSDESLGKKIAETTKTKVPYILVVGEKEEKKGTVAVRKRDTKKQDSMKTQEFVRKTIKEIEQKK